MSGGSFVAALAWLTSNRYLGLGTPTVEASDRGAWVATGAAALKILPTAISLGMGGGGGIVTPVRFIGATAGITLGTLLGSDRGPSAPGQPAQHPVKSDGRLRRPVTAGRTL